MGNRSNRLEGTRDLEGAGAAVGAGGAGGATPWSEDELQAFRRISAHRGASLCRPASPPVQE